MTKTVFIFGTQGTQIVVALHSHFSLNLLTLSQFGEIKNWLQNIAKREQILPPEFGLTFVESLHCDLLANKDITIKMLG